MLAAEAGLFQDGDGDQHSPHRPGADHWRHAEWLWGPQPEVWLRGRPRLFPRLDTPLLPAEGQGQRVHINTHMLRSNHLDLLSPRSKKPVFSFVAEKIHSSPEKKRAPQALSWKRWSGETTPRPCRARITWLYLSNGSDIRKRTFDAVADSGTLPAMERIHSPRAPSSPDLPLSGCSRCCSKHNHRGTFVQNRKKLKVLQKGLFDKTVIIIIIILYNIVPFRIQKPACAPALILERNPTNIV